MAEAREAMTTADCFSVGYLLAFLFIGLRVLRLQCKLTRVLDSHSIAYFNARACTALVHGLVHGTPSSGFRSSRARGSEHTRWKFNNRDGLPTLWRPHSQLFSHCTAFRCRHPTQAAAARAAPKRHDQLL